MSDNALSANEKDGTTALNLPQRILAALEGLQYGAIEITVHDGKVVAIERRERFRFPRGLISTA